MLMVVVKVAFDGKNPLRMYINKSWFGCYAAFLLPAFDILCRASQQKCASCTKPAAVFLPRSHQVDIRLCSHRLLHFGDNKSAAGCQQA